MRIFIPGSGNNYEAEYFVKKGFSNITVIDIAPTLVAVLQEKFKNKSEIQVILGDFFEHQGEYDLILEQTFFLCFASIYATKIGPKNAPTFGKRRNSSRIIV